MKKHLAIFCSWRTSCEIDLLLKLTCVLKCLIKKKSPCPISHLMMQLYCERKGYWGRCCNCDLWFYSYVAGFCMWNLLIWFGYLGLNVWKLGASLPCWGEQDLLWLRFNSPKEERELISVVKQWADFCGALISTCKLFHDIVRKSKIELSYILKLHVCPSVWAVSGHCPDLCSFVLCFLFLFFFLGFVFCVS